MPNWVWNTLDTENAPERFRELMLREQDGTLVVDYDILVPEPPELREDPETLTLAQREWRSENWGTKWTCAPARIDGTEITWKSPWSCPVPYLTALSEAVDVSFCVTASYEDPVGAFTTWQFEAGDAEIIEEEEGYDEEAERAVEYESYDRLRKCAGTRGSWAVWAEEDWETGEGAVLDSAVRSLGDVDEDDYADMEPQLRRDVVLVVLNSAQWSTPDRALLKARPFASFHPAAGRNARLDLLASALVDVGLSGVYMTSLVAAVDEDDELAALDDEALTARLLADEDLLTEQLSRMRDDLAYLDEPHPLVIVVGDGAGRILRQAVCTEALEWHLGGFTRYGYVSEYTGDGDEEAYLAAVTEELSDLEFEAL